MKIVLAAVRGKPKSAACEALVADYVARSGRLAALERVMVPSEEKLFGWIEQAARSSRVRTVLFDSGGDLVTSEDLAKRVADAGVSGVQRLIFAVGPADGWSRRGTELAGGLLLARVSFGRITLPHELALAVAAEQIYRALTINASHPYHGGH